MNHTASITLSPVDVVRLLRKHWKTWVLPAVCVAGLVAVYAVLRPETWEATQTLIIRNEAANNELGPGKFGHTDEMKAVQETLLELARSRAVLAAGLKTVGPPADYDTSKRPWPGQRDVENLRGEVEIAAPNGAEFGRTEVFYLKVKDGDPQRAIALNRAVCDELMARFQEIRDAKAASMIVELQETVGVARADLDEATARVAEIERRAGDDLGELRSLIEGGYSDNSLGRTTSEIRNELRQLQARTETIRELLGLLHEAQNDPSRLVATPNELLDSQPALRTLKDGLVAAQIRAAELGGRLNDEHPLARAAKEAEANVAAHLHEELALAVRGLQVELSLADQRERMLTERLDDVSRRLENLAGQRADYANCLAEVAHRTALLEAAERNLSEARATHAAARATSLVDRIDTAATGSDPVGPGRTVLLAAGVLGGLLVGFGMLFLFVQPESPVTAAPPSEAVSHDRPLVRPNGHDLAAVGKLTFKEALTKLDGTRA